MSSPQTATEIIDVHCGWGATGTAPDWKDVAAVRRDLAARGIRHAFVSSMLARRYDLPAGNDALSSALASPSGSGEAQLRGWLVIHPARLADCNVQMRRHLHLETFVGAALYPDQTTNHFVSTRDVQEVINSFRRFAKPLLVEARTAEAMAHVVALAEDLGNVRVIASGMGGDEWREAIPLAARPLNLFLDISGALVPDKIDYALTVFGGARKLLFGSGAPQTDPAAMLGMLDDLPNLSAEDRHRILRGNAARLFGLGTDAAVPLSLTPLIPESNVPASEVSETQAAAAPPVPGLGRLSDG